MTKLDEYHMTRMSMLLGMIVLAAHFHDGVLGGALDVE